MKRKILALAALVIFAACSSDDETITEPIVEEPVDLCLCLVNRYRVNTTMYGHVIDTVFMYGGYVNTSNGIYKEECGTNRWQVDLTTFYQAHGDTNPFFYETENYIAE